MRILALLPLLALAACGAPRSEVVDVTRPQPVRVIGGTGQVTSMATVASHRPSIITLPMSADSVWRVLPGVYQSLDIAVTDLQTASRLIGISNTRVRRRFADANLSRYIDCGRTQGGPNADSYEINLSVRSQVEPREDGQAVLNTLVDAAARPVNFSGEFARCHSTGVLERRIADLVRAQLAG